MSPKKLPPGKLPAEMLGELLARLPGGDPRVLVGPRVGEDAAVIDFGDRLLVAKTDPITFASDLIGWYAVNVNANDIAAMGAEPRWFMASLLLPERQEADEVGAIFDQISRACTELGVTSVGGHTEVTVGLDRAIMVGCMMGEVERDGLITSAGARPGDVAILAGAIAVEGTALLAREVGEELTRMGMEDSAVGEARDLLFEPGISVVAAARAARDAGGVTALHDPTEGGLATGLMEVALASDVGLEIDAEAIPVLALTQEVCARLGLDALGLIASGSLLIMAAPEAAAKVVGSLQGVGVEAAVIGRAGERAGSLDLLVGAKRQPLPRFARDEVARFFDERASRG